MTDIERLGNYIGEYVMRNFVEPRLSTTVSYYRATVISPEQGGKIGIVRPFETNTVYLPCTAAASALQAGDQCIVLVLGDLSNAVVFSDGKMSNV